MLYKLISHKYYEIVYVSQYKAFDTAIGILVEIMCLVFSFVHKMCICLEKIAVTGHPLSEYVIRHSNGFAFAFAIAMCRTRTRQTVTIIPNGGDNAQDMLLNSRDLLFASHVYSCLYNNVLLCFVSELLAYDL